MDLHIERQPSHYLGLTSGEWALLVIFIVILAVVTHNIVGARRRRQNISHTERTRALGREEER